MVDGGGCQFDGGRCCQRCCSKVSWWYLKSKFMGLEV